MICARALAQLLAAFISLGGGAPVGQYGPLVHFGAAIGSYLSELFGSRRITADVFIGCGVAAAIAAGFHAPIAGVVFAHEAVLRHFSFRAITPIAIASITSAWFSSAMFGGQPIFQIDVVLPDLLPLVPTLLASGLFFGLDCHSVYETVICQRQIGSQFWSIPIAAWTFGGGIMWRCSHVCSRGFGAWRWHRQCDP